MDFIHSRPAVPQTAATMKAETWFVRAKSGGGAVARGTPVVSENSAERITPLGNSMATRSGTAGADQVAGGGAGNRGGSGSARRRRDQPLIDRLLGVNRSFSGCEGARQRFTHVAEPFADTFLLGDVTVAYDHVQPRLARCPPPRAYALVRRTRRRGGAGCGLAGCASECLKQSGPKGPSEALLQAIVELTSRNPRFGGPRSARIISRTFGANIDKHVVYRVLSTHSRPIPGGTEPSWVSFIGHTTDSLWSVDLCRCESIVLRSDWVLVVMDQFTRRAAAVLGSRHRGRPAPAAPLLCVSNSQFSR